jgi:thiol-disulfide isomerase/thioredoxin
MRFSVFVIFSLAFLFSITSDGQKIIFNDISLEAAKLLAKEKNKNIFIDTYADWCVPCKQMEKEFLKPSIANFFNEAYINVKINVESSLYANEYRKAFDIVFLPTLIIIDANGNIKYKADKLIDGNELMAIADKARQSNVYFFNDAAEVINSPMGQNGTVSKGPEVIVHTLGSKNSNPEILMKEAYFRIELMDGSHRKKSSEYLETQTDWSTPKNMRFILDFLYSTNTPEFEYFSKNIEKFKAEFGENEIVQTLDILIAEELEKAFPRPNFNRVNQLFSLKNSSDSEEKTYLYFMDRHLDECNLKEFKNIATQYLEKYPSSNPEIYANIGLACTEEVNINNKELDLCIKATEMATQLKNNIPYYYEQLCELYLLKKEKKNALNALKKAKEIAKSNSHDLDYYTALEKKMNAQ